MRPSRAVSAAVLAAALAVAPASGAIADTLDQSDLTLDSQSSSAVINGLLTNAQVFTVGLAGQLSRVDVRLSIGLGPLNADPQVEIREATLNAGPGSQVLATATVPRADIGASPGSLVAFALPRGPQVAPGQVLAIVVRYLPSAASSVLWSGSAGAYAGGASWYSSDGGQTWTTSGNPIPDQVFATYVRVPAPAASPAPIVQQVGAPRGTCDGVDDAGLSYGTGVRGGWSPSWAQWVNDGRGGAVCTRTLQWQDGRWSAAWA